MAGSEFSRPARRGGSSKLRVQLQLGRGRVWGITRHIGARDESVGCFPSVSLGAIGAGCRFSDVPTLVPEWGVSTQHRQDALRSTRCKILKDRPQGGSFRVGETTWRSASSTFGFGQRGAAETRRSARRRRRSERSIYPGARSSAPRVLADRRDRRDVFRPGADLHRTEHARRPNRQFHGHAVRPAGTRRMQALAQSRGTSRGREPNSRLRQRTQPLVFI